MTACDSARLTEMWVRIADEIATRREEFNELDRLAGDGDHGENLDRGLRAVAEQFRAQPPADSPSAFRSAGEIVMLEVAGTAGFLLGSGLVRASVVLDAADRLDAGTVHDALQAAADVIGRLGKAVAGDKTMLDALEPAATITGKRDRTGSAAAALVAAAAAARDGAAKTAGMTPTKGRASYVAERSLGSQDPGATSMATFLTVVADEVSRG